MLYTPEEEDFILWLAEAYTEGFRRNDPDEARAELGMDQETFDAVLDTAKRQDLCGLRQRVPAGGRIVSPHARAVEVAREIEARREAAEEKQRDLVARFVAWARSNKVTAPLIVTIQVAGPVVGLIGGICGIVALLLRGC